MDGNRTGWVHYDMPTQSLEEGSYTGAMRHGKPHGQGTWTWPDGSYYSGQFENGQCHGYGMYVDAEKKRTWVGNFIGGKLEGDGYQKTEYCQYMGSFVQGRLEGKGFGKYSDGHTYHGEFRGNNREGMGRYEWPKRGYYYGGFQKNKMNGKGYRDSGRYTYDGEFLHDRYHGVGKFTNSKGVVWEGKWVDGMLTKGSESYPCGSRYEGEFKGVLAHGKGKVVKVEQCSALFAAAWRIDRDRSGTHEGMWKDGQSVGNLSYIAPEKVRETMQGRDGMRSRSPDQRGRGGDAAWRNKSPVSALDSIINQQQP